MTFRLFVFEGPVIHHPFRAKRATSVHRASLILLAEFHTARSFVVTYLLELLRVRVFSCTLQGCSFTDVVFVFPIPVAALN